MTQINKPFKTKDMKKLYEILFEDKKPEQQPLKLEIKLMSTATPNNKCKTLLLAYSGDSAVAC